jgi:hypothetical protein
MAVIHHALLWQMTEPACAAARAAAEVAQDGDAAALAALGEQFRRAGNRPAALAAFDLADPAYLKSWLAPDAVHPALVTLLAWMPDFHLLGDQAASVLAGLYRRGGSPVGPLALAGDLFRPLPQWLAALFGASPFDARPIAGQSGMWVRVLPLLRRLRRDGDEMGAALVARAGGPDLARSWLVTTTIW